MIKTNQQHYSFEELQEIISMLRGENGCPWDRVQTHDSLRPCMMEEAAELVASIRIYNETGNCENMREELGDVLLQVVMQTEIAGEEGLFGMEDVITEIARKMIRRHPHVFGTGEADTPEQVVRTWEEIKEEEKAGKSRIASPLQEIPPEFPALTRAVKVLKKIDKLYEPGPQAAKEARALAEHAERLRELTSVEEDCGGELEQVMGDMLLSLCSMAGKYKLTPEQILSDRVQDLIKQYEKG